MRAHVATIVFALVSTPLFAQSQPPVVTAEDYARAEQFLGRSTSPLVIGGTIRLTWISDDRAWYRATSAEGSEFRLIDAATGSQGPVFDHARLADALSAVADTTYDGRALPFTQIEFPSDSELAFQIRQTQWVCDLDEYRCASPPASRVPPDRNVVLSPDGTRAAFIREHNLWVREVTTGDETQLTTDGIEDFGYATDNAGWTKSGRPVLVWSPDSRKIATFQHDARGVGDMYLVTTEIGHPELEAWKYPLPEDSVIFRISRVIIDVDAGRMVRLQLAPDQHRSTICDHIRCGGTWADIDWAEDGSAVAFVSTSRDHKDEYVRIADAETGAVRDVFEEHVETFFESGYNTVNWHWLPKSNEFIWYSQRDNWGHLYLYDATTGEVKHQITSGDWNVLQLRRIDEENRTLFFTGAGREPGDPYFQYFYLIGMDGRGLTLLAPNSANHSVRLSPTGTYMVDSYSTPTIPAVTVLRDTDRGHV
ncbi:MAG: DPP IV N-terminal domain-containing protein, partial [Gemmatimonadales bacterium]